MKNSKLICLMLAVLMLLSIVGCAQTAAPDAAEPADTSANEPADTPADTSTDIKEVPREKTLIFENIEGRVPDPTNQNPYSNGQYADWGLWQANQECLFYMNFETQELQPWQATGYKYSDDFTELTIYLREGVKWNDGEVFNADDVVFTINMLKNNPELRYSNNMVEWVKDIVAVNDYEVKFILNKPGPSFLTDYFCNRVWDCLVIAPEHIWSKVENPATFGNYDLEAGLPVGTGPYKLVRSTETEQVYDRCDTWWGAEVGFEDMPEPERVIWMSCSSEEVRAAMLTNNELDGSWTLSRSTFETAQAKNSNIISWTTDLPYAYLDACPSAIGFNNDVFPTNDPEIKWAIAYAVNQQEIVDIAAEGLSTPAQTLFPTYPALQDFLDRNANALAKYDVTTFDPAKTEEIMTGKGYTKDGDGLWVDADGNHITFTIIYRSGETLNMKEAPIIVQQLRDAGFDVDSQALESAVFYNAVYSGEAVAWFGSTLGSVSDPYTTLEFFTSKYYKPIGENTDAKSYRWRNSEYDALIEKMSALSSDDPAFQEAANKALEIWLSELPALPLMQQYLLTPFNTTYWTNWPTVDNNYIQPTEWWYNCNIMIHNVHAVN